MSDAGDANEAYEAAACGLLNLEAKGRIERANRLIAEWTGIAHDALIGSSFQDLFTVGSKLFLQTQWWPLVEMQGSVAEVQLELVRPNGPNKESLPVLV